MLETNVGKIKFESDLNAYSKAIKRTYKTALKRTIMFLSNQIINRSPYDEGAFIASHKISFDFVNDEIYNGPKLTKGAAKAIAKKEQKKVKNINQDVIDNLTMVWLSNNVPYGRSLEYGLYPPGPKISGGYSKQAPKGVYRLSAQSAENKIKEIIKEAEMEEMRSLKK